MTEDQQTEQKKHAACDECRIRKLKCSGEQPICQRCQTEGLQCIYSPRKKMGRPRKRARDDKGPSPGIEANHTGQLPLFDVNSFGQTSPIVGIPGTGMPLPLSMVEQMQTMNYDTTNDPSMQWIDPMLQTTSLEQTNLGFSAMFPLVPPMDANQTLQISSSSEHPTPHSNSISSDSSATCHCLPNLYLTLSDIGANKDWSFPFSVHKLKSAMRTSDSVLRCTICPHESTSAIQNLMMLTTLLTTIVDCYRKILRCIRTQAEQAENAGTTIQYRMGDSDPSRWHMHTGTNDCPMGVNIDLDPSEYEMLARKVIRADVHGAKNSPMGQISILDLITRLEQRQHEWHNGASSAEMRQHYSQNGECRPQEGQFSCLRLIAIVKHQVGLLNL